MSSSESLHLDQRIGLRLSQQQLRFVKLLELNAQELDDAVHKEMQENPALIADEETPPPASALSSYSGLYPATKSQSVGEQYYPEPADAAESLYDYLHRQLDELTIAADAKEIAHYIIDSLDSNGWLRRPVEALRNDLIVNSGKEIPEALMNDAFSVVRSLDPPGVGALSLQDCLGIQLQRMKKSQTVSDALFIINEHFDAFAMKHSHKIISALKLDRQRAKDALNLVLSLNPKPGAAFSGRDSNNVIVPDVVVDIDDDEISLRLNNRIPELQIDTSFESALQDMNISRRNREKESATQTAHNGRHIDFVATRLRDARDFIKILSQRQHTILQVATAIVSIQKQYFLTRDVYTLKPMMIKDIANLTGLDISVISRATGNKYLATPWGTLPMRFFFSDSIGESEGSDAVTNRKIEAEISRIVEAEDKRHPLSDEKIKQHIEATGFEISRRTVAKYRDRMGIPVARLRKNLTS